MNEQEHTALEDALNTLGKELKEHMKVCPSRPEPAAPWWASGVLGVVSQVGPVVGVLFFFIAMFAGWITSPFDKQADRLTAIEVKVNTNSEAIVRNGETTVNAVKTVDETMRLLIANTKESIRVNRIICRNTAKSDAARELCDEKL